MEQSNTSHGSRASLGSASSGGKVRSRIGTDVEQYGGVSRPLEIDKDGVLVAPNTSFNHFPQGVEYLPLTE